MNFRKKTNKSLVEKKRQRKPFASKVDKTTKREVAKATAEAKNVEIDDLSKKVITDAKVRIKVERQYSGGSDATSFEVKDNISYNEIMIFTEKWRKKV